MRLIVINDYLTSNAGGATNVAMSSLKTLSDAGLDVTYLAGSGSIKPSINMGRVKCIPLDMGDLLNNGSRLNAVFTGIWNIKAAQRLQEILGEYSNKDTVVHIHSWTKSFSSIIFNILIKKKFKVVITLHDYFSACPNGAFFNYVQQSHCSLRPMSIGCALENCDRRSRAQKVWRLIRHYAQNKFAKFPGKFNYFISVSNYSERILRPYLPKDAMIFRIRNPINYDKQAPADPSKNNAYVFIGRFSIEKGTRIFAQAAQKSGVSAVFIGDGPDQEIVKKLYPQATFIGWQDAEGVAAEIRKSRAIVVPSIVHETQGLVVLEAASQGIPAIVSDDCAAVEFIQDKFSGLRFKARNVNDLVEKLLLLERDDKLVESMGKVAYKNYWDNPSTLDNHVSLLIKCYRKILEN